MSSSEILRIDEVILLVIWRKLKQLVGKLCVHHILLGKVAWREIWMESWPVLLEHHGQYHNSASLQQEGLFLHGRMQLISVLWERHVLWKVLYRWKEILIEYEQRTVSIHIWFIKTIWSNDWSKWNGSPNCSFFNYFDTFIVSWEFLSTRTWKLCLFNFPST